MTNKHFKNVQNNMSRDISIASIEAGKYRMRTRLPDVEELAASIREQGLLEPIGVLQDGEQFTLVYGDRRLAACKQLGWTTIPAIILQDEQNALFAALTENVQRHALNPIEEADAFRRVLETGITQKTLAKKIGVTQSYIAHKLRLKNLPRSVQVTIHPLGWLTEGHARQLLRLEKIVTDITGNDVKHFDGLADMYATEFQANKNAPHPGSGVVDVITYYQDRMVWNGIIAHNNNGQVLSVREVEARINKAQANRDLKRLFTPSDWEEDLND